MSDEQETQVNEESEPYSSQIDSLFATAWNEVYSPEESDPAAEGGSEAGAAGSGDSASTVADQGAGSAENGAGVQAPGAGPGSEDDDTSTGAGDRTGDGASTSSESAYTAADGVGDLEVATVVAQLGPASTATNERMVGAFRNAAIQEFQAEIDPKFTEALRYLPMQMVGMEVPSIAANAKPGEMTRLTDSESARKWQETVNTLIDRQIDSMVAEKVDEARPMTSIIQESFLMFQNNHDLVPGTKQFDPELARS